MEQPKIEPLSSNNDFITPPKGRSTVRKAWMRNKKCPCNSGKKFKKCCWNNEGMVKVLHLLNNFNNHR